jgi:streptomycin 6-kinase
VLAVTTAHGTQAVLKIAEPGTLDVPVRVMRAADGQGYARVLAWEAPRGAVLVERLGATLWEQTAALAEQATVVVPLLQQVWRVPVHCGKAFEGKASGLLQILAGLGPRYGSGQPAALRLATLFASELAVDERPEVVCHGDPHGGNVLRRADGWAFIDPDGFVGERAYDLGVVLRDACAEIEAAEVAATGSGATLLAQLCRALCELAAVDADRVWRWAFVERVTTGLYLAWFGYADESARFLRTAETIARGF